MKYIEIPNTNIKISQLCFGCFILGGHGHGDVDLAECRLTIKEALNNGINFFDTADVYGMGAAEIFLSKVLDNDIKSVFIATKGGIRIGSDGKSYVDNSSEWLTQAVEDSLQRLKLDSIDLYQIHKDDEKYDMSYYIELFDKFRQLGKIKYLGFSNFRPSRFTNIKLPSWVISNQFEYSLAFRNEENTIKYNSDNNLLNLAYGTLAQGLFGGKYNKNTSFDKNDRRANEKYINFHKSKFDKNLVLLDRVRELANKIGTTTAQIALRWCLDYSKIDSLIVGVRDRNQLNDILAIKNFVLCDSDINFLKENSSLLS